jgi:hypothetical protein
MLEVSSIHSINIKTYTMKNLLFINEGRLYITPHYSFKIITMKLFKTAFGLNLLATLLLSILTYIMIYVNQNEAAAFFGISAFAFLLLLPNCSREE